MRRVGPARGAATSRAVPTCHLAAARGQDSSRQDAREDVPPGTHGLLLQEAAGAVAWVHPQDAIFATREKVGLAITAEVSRAHDRGEYVPSRTDDLTWQPTTRSIAGVEVEKPCGRAGDDVSRAVTGEVPGAERRGEDAPASADLSGVLEESPRTVAGVQHERAVRPPSHQVRE